jgi:hypothetical protein
MNEYLSPKKTVNAKPRMELTSKYYHLMCKTNIGFDIFFGGSFLKKIKIRLGVNIMGKIFKN